MRRRLLNVANGNIKASESKAGDICLYDKTNDCLIIVSKDRFDGNVYPLTDYSPVGVVVVPGVHDIYGTGECAVISLSYMNCDTPSTGSTDPQSMLWGDYGVNVTTLTDYTVLPIIGEYVDILPQLKQWDSWMLTW